MINNFDQEANMQVLELSIKLADIFEDNIIDESYIAGREETVLISEEGMELLGNTFEKVVEGLRGAVFESLLDELAERDIPFDIEQFADKSAQVKVDV